MDTDLNATRQPQIIGVACMLLFLSTAAVVLRLLFRRKLSLGLWYDDYTIIVALMMSWASPICNLIGLRYGLGRHVDAVAPEKVMEYLKVLYGFEIVWTFTVPMIKLSLLLLYNRIFPVDRVRYATYAVGFFVVTWLLWAGISTIAQCIPVEYFWNTKIPGHCIDNDAFYIAAGAVNVFTDFAIIAIPIPIIWKLQKLSMDQKIGFVAIFSLGGWVCIVSIIRLVYIGRISAEDITWTDAWGGMWSSLEVSLDVVAACLPVIAPGLLKMARQGSFSWSHLRSSLLHSARNSTVDASFHGLNQRAGDRSMERMISPEQGCENEDKPRLDKTLIPRSKLEGDSREDLELGQRPTGTGALGTV